ncbi:hypothetical protein [Sphingobacterium sp. FBM7-1]|uniref:hypothetical protein n=1 Tax=Sphingobacterium sp. FBM7-1 TaxID=2886688 RepID=UPI001D1011F3|nr:hypothetical protein [Sphingobacterium sp. FBM7-1]MCC2600497.1 hypothetical protein [Sphingobacterium sp. FBM7-1]
MKTILNIFIYILLCSNMTLAQSVKTINTGYSKIEGGKIGSDKKIFQIYNSSIDKIDNYYNTRFSYGPLKLNKTGYSNEGFYFELYESDISSDPLKFLKMRELFSYRLLYEYKGGNLLFIQESKINRSSNKISNQIYYTEDGYNKATGASNRVEINNSTKASDFDVEELILNTRTMNQLMAKINFSFEQKGDKTISDDGKYVTVTYENDSSIKPLITYTKEGTPSQIVLIMPLVDVDRIIKKLIHSDGAVEKDEEIHLGNLIYNFRGEKEVGMVIITYKF